MPFSPKEKAPLAVRFRALDGMRGFAALMVVLYHLQSNDLIHFGKMVGHGDVFVDLFFVLSGFVIHLNYRDRINSASHAILFLLKRIARLMPLHISILLGMLAFQILLGIHFDNSPISKLNGDHSIQAFCLSLLLLHGLGFYNYAVWNGPSWSISVEFAAYILYALGAKIFRRSFLVFSLLLIVGSFLFLVTTHSYLFPEMSNRIFRCIFGFFLGVLSCHFVGHRPTISLGANVDTAIQCLAILCSLGFVYFVQDNIYSMALPAAFLCAIVSIVLLSGRISPILASRIPGLMGDLSYSSYMIHIPLLSVFSRIGILKTPNAVIDVKTAFGVSIFLFALFVLSLISYKFLECPAREYLNTYLRQKFPKT